MSVYAHAHQGQLGHGHSHTLWRVVGGILLLLIFFFSGLSQVSQPAPVSCIPPQCSQPPPSQPLVSNPGTYTSSQYGFTVNYPGNRDAPTQKTKYSVSWSGTLSDGSDVEWTIVGGTPRGRSAQQIVSDLQSSNFPDAQQAYTIPGASVGYQPGYGNVYDVNVAPGGGQSVHDRLIVMAAIRGNLAIALVGLGPYEHVTRSNSDHPNPAETPLVNLGDFHETLQSVTWPGQPTL